MNKWIRIGRITGVNPAKRELRVATGPQHLRDFKRMRWVHVRFRDGATLRCAVESAAPAGEEMKVTLGPGTTRDSVGRMKGAEVVAEKVTRRRSDSGDFHVSELVGFTVLNKAGEPIGLVHETYSSPAHEIIEVSREGFEPVLAPAVPEVVRDIDFERRTLVIVEFERFEGGADAD